MGNNTLIYVDKGTRQALKQLAGDKPLAAFLRDLANGVEQAPVPVNELEALRSAVLKRLDVMDEKLKVLAEVVFPEMAMQLDAVFNVLEASFKGKPITIAEAFKRAEQHDRNMTEARKRAGSGASVGEIFSKLEEIESNE